MEKMERQVQRKIQEQYLAIELEKKVNDKNWILENYLNSINLGSNTLGVQAAAQRYFGKDVSKLTLSECAVIAGITKNPAGYNPILHPKENAKRRKNVLDAMKKQGYISQKQYDKAMADDVYGRISEHNDVREETMNTYFVDAVIDDVFDDLVNIKGYSESEAYKAIYQGTYKGVCGESSNRLYDICEVLGVKAGLASNAKEDHAWLCIAAVDKNGRKYWQGVPATSYARCLSWKAKLGTDGFDREVGP